MFVRFKWRDFLIGCPFEYFINIKCLQISCLKWCILALASLCTLFQLAISISYIMSSYNLLSAIWHPCSKALKVDVLEFVTWPVIKYVCAAVVVVWKGETSFLWRVYNVFSFLDMSVLYALDSKAQLNLRAPSLFSFSWLKSALSLMLPCLYLGKLSPHQSGHQVSVGSLFVPPQHCFLSASNASYYGLEQSKAAF